MDGLDQLWADLLSGNPERTQRAWSGLTAPERQAVLAHLDRMATADGWHPAQRAAAAAALKILHGLSGQRPNQTK